MLAKPLLTQGDWCSRECVANLIELYRWDDVSVGVFYVQSLAESVGDATVVREDGAVDRLLIHRSQDRRCS